jgi:hypothetical protein
MVTKERRLPGKGLIEKDLPGRIGEMVFTSNDMGHTHQMVIDDAGEVIGGHPIRANDDEIANSCGIEIHLSMDEVFKNDGPSPHAKSNGGSEARGFHLANLLLSERTAPSIIPGHLSFGELFFPEVLQSFFGAEALVALSFLK